MFYGFKTHGVHHYFSPPFGIGICVDVFPTSELQQDTSKSRYPPVNKRSNGKSPFSIGNTSSKGLFSIAMLVYQREQLLFHGPKWLSKFGLPWGFGETSPGYNCLDIHPVVDRKGVWDEMQVNALPWKDHLKNVFHMGVSKNRGTPKWMVYNGKPY